jgi:predicted ATPase
MIRPDQVAIYFTEMADQGCQLLRIGLNDDGELDRFPPGVFEEDFGEVAAIRRAQRKRHAKPRG